MNHRLEIRRTLSLGFLLTAVIGLLIGVPACSMSAPDAEDAAAMAQFVAQIGDQPGAAPAGAQTGEMKNLAVIAVNSYDKLMGDVSFLGSLAGMQGANQILEASILGAIEDKGLAAIDKTKPWGVILQTDGNSFPPLAAIPVKKADDLLTIAQSKGIQVAEREKGVRELAVPNGPSLFVKVDGGWAIVGQSAESVARIPANLETDLTKLVSNYDIAARVNVQSVPKMYRDLFVSAMRSGMEEAMQQKPGESADQFEARRQTPEAQLKEFEQMADEMDKLTIGLAVDPQQQKGYFDVVVEVVPEGKLAKQLAAQREARTNFAGFYQADAAATLAFVNQVDPAAIQENMASMRASLEAMRQELNDAIDNDANVPAELRDAVKAAASDFAEALFATSVTGKMDGAAALRVSNDSLTLIGGAHVKDTEKVVSGLKKLEAAAKQQSPGFPGFKWNAAEHAGVSFHTLEVPLPPEADETVKRMLGEQLAVAVGIGPETVYLAVGRDNLEAIKHAIDASAAEPNKLVPPFEMALSLGPILELAAAHATDDDVKMPLQMLASSLQSDAQGRDHIRMVGQMLPNGIRYRFEAEEGALRAVGQAIFMAQMQMAR